LHAILWFNSPSRSRRRRPGPLGRNRKGRSGGPADRPRSARHHCHHQGDRQHQQQNGATVPKLAKGKPVTEVEVLALFDAMCSSPSKPVFNILTRRCHDACPCAAVRIPSCPPWITRAAAMARAATVKLESLYDLVLAPRPGKEGGTARMPGKSKSKVSPRRNSLRLEFGRGARRRRMPPRRRPRCPRGLRGLSQGCVTTPAGKRAGNWTTVSDGKRAGYISMATPW